jgi:mersacidin/lichenicidin family type 2 lantibiotic
MTMDPIRAWKDPEYRATLGAGELRSMPENPAGTASLMSLSDSDLDGVAGAGTAGLGTLGCCQPTFQISLGTSGLACLLTCLG